MPKPITRRARVQSSDTFVGAEIHASGAQQTGPSAAARNAAALSSALNLGSKFALDRKQARQDEDLAAGTLAAQQGDVDIETLRQQEKSAAWVKGAERVIGRARAIEDEAALKEWYASEFDKNKDLPTLRKEMDAWMKDRYDGLDPGIAGEVAPYLSRGANALMKAHGDSETAEGAAMVANGLSTSTAEWLSRSPDERTPEEWDAIRNEYTALYPTREAGLKALAEDVANSMVLHGNELGVAENPMFEKLRTNPATREIMQAGIEEAKTKRIKAHLEATKIERGMAYAELTQLGNAKDTKGFFEKLKEYSTADADGVSLLTEGEVQTQIGNFYSTTGKAVLTTSMVERYGEGNGNQIPKELRDEAFDAWFAQVAGDYPEEEVVPRAVERIVKNGFIPGRIKDMFETASPSNPERWSQAYAFYQQFEAQSPGELAQYIKESKLKEFEAFDMLSTDYGPQQAAELMRGEHDPKLFDEWTREEREIALKDVLDAATDIPWSWSEIEDTPRLRKHIESRMRFIAGFNYPPEQAAQFAMAEISKRFQIIDGEMYPAESPWGDAGDDAAEWFRTTQAENVRLVPVGGEPGYVWVRPSDSLLPTAGNKVRISDIARDYADHRSMVRDEAASARNAKVTEKRRQEAMSRLFPALPKSVSFGPAQDQINAQREAAWSALTPSEQDAIFTDMRREQEADIASRKRMANKYRDNARNNPNPFTGF